MENKLEDTWKVPRHVAIILDGNGRWAKAKGMPRNYGHVQGAKTVETICEEAYKMGIQYLTVYAFSTENWNRPKDEVDALMKLLRNYMRTCLQTAKKNRMCVKVLGEKSRLDEDIRTRIAELEEATKENDGLHFQIAINYGGRDEIVRAAKSWQEKQQLWSLSRRRLTRKFSRCVWILWGFLTRIYLSEPAMSREFPTSCYGSLPIRNFVLPRFPGRIFTKEELKKAIEAYNHRERRYGGVKEE